MASETMNRPLIRALRGAGALGAVLAAAWIWAATRADEVPAAHSQAVQLASAAVTGSAQAGLSAYDGVVQALRQTAIAAQVSGAVVALDVKAGDNVKAGQVLLRLDARAAEQTAAAGAAQVRAARAALDAAGREFDRQKQLLEKKYISQAAFDRAEAQYKSAQAEAAAQLANAGAARTQSDFYVIRAPYAGVVSDVPVVLGDMAMPGRPLVTVYDPQAMRISANVPQTVAARLAAGATPMAEVPGAAKGQLTPVRFQLLPAVDAATHTQELRLDLAPGTQGIAPGMFARAWLPLTDGGGARLFVPAQAIVRRAELTAVYVIGEGGKPLLRQVRLGPVSGDRVEVLSGVSAGERVALDPHAAAAVR